jgi:hypothetical protein
MSNAFTNPSASFTRPANVTAYASGDLVANDTVAANVVPLKLQLPMQGASALLRRLRLRKSSASITTASFRVHLFRTSPTPVAVGDNAALASLPGDGTNYLGSVDVTFDQAFASGATGFGAFATDSHVHQQTFDGGFIYALIEARSAYTPASGETFELQLQVRTA